jgi:hypothetical protein
LEVIVIKRLLFFLNRKASNGKSTAETIVTKAKSQKAPKRERQPINEESIQRFHLSKHKKDETEHGKTWNKIFSKPNVTSYALLFLHHVVAIVVFDN